MQNDSIDSLALLLFKYPLPPLILIFVLTLMLVKAKGDRSSLTTLSKSDCDVKAIDIL